MTSFPTPDPIFARIDIVMGDIGITAAPSAETVVAIAPSDPASERDRRAAEATRVSCADGRLDIVGPRRDTGAFTRKVGSVRVSVALPAGSSLEATAGVGVIASDVSLAAVTAKSGAGDIRLQDATSVDLRTGLGTIAARRIAGAAHVVTGSGTVRIDRVDGTAEVRNSNGDIRIGDSGASLRVKAANGSVAVERAHADLILTTANGNLAVGCAERGSLQLRTSLGSIHLGIRSGTAARLDVRTAFGAVRNGLDATAGPGAGEDTVEVRAETSAGDIDIVRVAVDVA